MIKHFQKIDMDKTLFSEHDVFCVFDLRGYFCCPHCFAHILFKLKNEWYHFRITLWVQANLTHSRSQSVTPPLSSRGRCR